MIPFIDLKTQQARLRSDIDKRMAAVLNHGGYIMGPEVRALEDELKDWSDASEVISCSSGTDALL
ncbi:MAG: DegT/DnrJ/EryC1/StrS family aminotransferase, partial [Candidatus Puniceispirillaceae bacterium]